jgi:CRP-like cAMP-binding protein
MSRLDNLILGNLPPESLLTLAGEEVTLKVGTILFSSDEQAPYLFFPLDHAIASLVRTSEEGMTVEAGIVGSDGVANVQSIITMPAATGTEGMVQREGRFLRVPTAHARTCFQTDPAFRDAVLAYLNCLFGQVSQNVLCNRVHNLEQRLAKWLLLFRSRIESDELLVSHEFLAHMLGIHRPGVTTAIAAFDARGLTQHSRGRVTILDRSGIEELSCECFRVLDDALRSLQAQLQRA